MFIKRPCQKYWRVNVAKIVTKVRVAISTEERRSPWQPTHDPSPGACQMKCSVCNEFLPKMQAGSGREEQWEGDKASMVTEQIEPKHMAMPLQTSREIYPLHHTDETPTLFYLRSLLNVTSQKIPWYFQLPAMKSKTPMPMCECFIN